jgi:TM2 domain-containing membrane protein YozV
VYRTLHQTVYVRPERSERNRWVALLLCFFGGFLGLHRFYVGKVGSGIWYLLTGGFFFFGAVADFFCILLGSFRDNEGLPLR